MASRTAKGSLNKMMGDYGNIRTLPAALSVGYLMASLYQFGGVSAITLNWLGGTGGYTLTAEHSILISLGAFAFAFASSETKQFENYENWEKVLIAAGPAAILGYEYVQAITDFFVNIGDPLGMQIAFALTVVSWAVAVQ